MESARELLDRYENGKITPETLLRRLMIIHHLEVGAALAALADFKDKSLVKELGEQLRASIDRTMGAADRRKVEEEKPPSEFKARMFDKSTQVLQRELVLFRELKNPNAEVPLSKLVAAVKKVEPDATSGAVTMNLSRLVDEGLVEKQRKGIYRGKLQGTDHIVELEVEIEVRKERAP